MGLFSKPSEDKVVDMFNSLSDTEKESVKQKLFGTQSAEEPKKESEEDSSDVVNDNAQTPVDAEPVDTGKSETSKDDSQPKETFEEMFKRLMEENKKEIETLKADFNQKFDEIAKAKEKNTEKKPFGLTEEGKTYKANSKPKETSQEMVKRLFGGNG